jgi:thiamine pyrophosphokinase
VAVRNPGVRAIVLAAGRLGDVGVVGPADLVIAADGGSGHAVALDLAIDVIVGDLDSIEPDTLQSAEAAGVAIEQHDPDKDATDLELALDSAMARGAKQVTVLGVGGGRADHHLANVLLLANPKYAAVDIDAWVDGSRVVVVHRARAIDVEEGATVTLLPIGGPASGVRTSGLRWPLRGETLTPGTSRGVSNVALMPMIQVEVESGTLLAVITPA